MTPLHTIGSAQPRERSQAVSTIADQGWVNVYRYFSSANIWPRGLPLDEARAPVPAYGSLPFEEIVCPIQQGLVDDDPDVRCRLSHVARASRPFRSGAKHCVDHWDVVSIQ